jgi:K+/H+ antiporter YhaU regulatory subunit KhtT
MYDKIEVLSINAEDLKQFISILEKGLIKEERISEINPNLKKRLSDWIQIRK